LIGVYIVNILTEEQVVAIKNRVRSSSPVETKVPES